MIVGIFRAHIAGKKGRAKQFWSDEEQVSIYAQPCAPGVTIAQVARRYAALVQVLHTLPGNG